MPVTNWLFTVMVSVTASPRVVLPVTVKLVNVPGPAVLLILIKSEPFQAHRADSPFAIVTPEVGPAPARIIDCVLELELMTV